MFCGVRRDARTAARKGPIYSTLARDLATLPWRFTPEWRIGDEIDPSVAVCPLVRLAWASVRCQEITCPKLFASPLARLHTRSHHRSKVFVCRVGEANLSTLCIGLFIQVPDWLTKELVIEILQSKIFLAIYYGGAALLALVGYLGRRKYSERNLKKLLDAHLEKASAVEGKERANVKSVIGQALQKARGLPTRGGISFNPSDVFQQAALLCAQRQPHLAIEVLKREATLSEATIGHAQHQLRLAQERAATAFYEIGTIQRAQDKGTEALDAFTAMLRVNPNDHDALWWLDIQHRELGSFDEAEQNFDTLLGLVGGYPEKVAEVKRELGAVYLGWKDYGEAERVLGEADTDCEKPSEPAWHCFNPRELRCGQNGSSMVDAGARRLR